MLELFAVTNRGLESISAEEMTKIHGIQITQIDYRRVHARYSGNVRRLLALRTVDDLFIQLAEWQAIGPHRTTLARLEQLSSDLDLWPAVAVRSEVQPLRATPAFSVSANFVGRRNYSADEIKRAIATSVAKLSGWHYVEDDRQSDVNLRIFIEHEQAVVGMRLANAPLYKRAYKHDHLPGSLKPSVAAALLILAQASPYKTVLDPCCGVGTILIEAAAQSFKAVGGDQEAAAIAAAQANATAAGVTISAQRWDARALPLDDSLMDCIISNLPWGHQVEINTLPAEFYRDACAEMERVLTKEGRIVLLTNLPHLIAFPTLSIAKQIEISLFGQQPTIVIAGPSIVTVD